MLLVTTHTVVTPRTQRARSFLTKERLAAFVVLLAALLVGSMIPQAADARTLRKRPAPTTTTTTGPPPTSTTLATSTATTTAAPVPAPIATTTTTMASGPKITTTTTVPAPIATTTTTMASGPKITTTTTTTALAPKPVLFGAATAAGPWDLSQLTSFEQSAGKPVSLYVYFASFAFDPNFDTATADAVRRHGATPVITWEPWDPGTGTVDQPAYSLATIANGAHDAYISRWAAQVAAWGQPLWLRFAHEMNGDWYPWSVGVNGNTSAQYVAAWRHVHDIFERVGARNVTWVWSPNVEYPGSAALSGLYPGDAYVDWAGVDGYNWGTSQSWSTWQTPDQVFEPTLAGLRMVTGRPIVIAETASAEAGGDKATWIRQLFSLFAANPDVGAFVWFDLNKETDWRIESSTAATRAFAAGVADARYR